jgi:hypothetical protein
LEPQHFTVPSSNAAHVFPSAVATARTLEGEGATAPLPPAPPTPLVLLVVLAPPAPLDALASALDDAASCAASEAARSPEHAAPKSVSNPANDAALP